MIPSQKAMVSSILSGDYSRSTIWRIISHRGAFWRKPFELLSDDKNSMENYADESTYNANQAKYVFRDMYALTQAAALEDTEKKNMN